MINIIHFGSPKILHIAESFNHLGFENRIIPWNELQPADIDNATAWVLSGSPLLITKTDISDRIKAIEFLKTATTPVLGICFGHQLLGILHGAEVFRDEEVRSLTRILIRENGDLFNGFKGSVLMQEDHTEGILLPPGFIHLASSDNYEVEAMKHPSKNIFGVQFHPEVSGENGMQLLSNFTKLI